MIKTIHWQNCAKQDKALEVRMRERERAGGGGNND